LGKISATERVAAHLREEILRGALCDPLPGVHALTTELGANHNTVEKALRLLEREGVLVTQGPGRRRRVAKAEGKAVRPLRLAILAFDPPAVELAEGYMADLVHRLGEAGHSVFFAEKYLLEMGMEVGRVARLVRRTEADAWVVSAGSREVLEWFAAQPVPAFALFGRRGGLPIAGVGPDHIAAGTAATRRLIELGHRRIVKLARRNRRLPVPGAAERAILDEMAAHGITTGAFNLPDWEETGEGFHACLQELFRHTPPTALIIEEAPFLVAALQFLGRRGLRVPEDVSLVCTDADPAFAWCEPTITHIRWDGRPVVQRVVRWAANVSHGREDRRQTLTKAEFVEGGTVGPAK
jgi:DNA-binding LacI/PurR family transcriptional regulator/DNA-binding transcriptional regulator YhcF (GntR family)